MALKFRFHGRVRYTCAAGHFATTASMTGTTLVVVTHDTRVAQWCGRLVELRDALVHADRVLSDGVRP